MGEQLALFQSTAADGEADRLEVVRRTGAVEIIRTLGDKRAGAVLVTHRRLPGLIAALSQARSEVPA